MIHQLSDFRHTGFGLKMLVNSSIQGSSPLNTTENNMIYTSTIATPAHPINNKKNIAIPQYLASREQ